MPYDVWLTLDQISGRLRLTRDAVIALGEHGHLKVIWGVRKSKKFSDSRGLDPSEDYAEQLRLAAIVHRKEYPAPPYLNERAMFTVREVASICGFSVEYTKLAFRRLKIKPIVVGPSLRLYSINQVREVLWRREKRTLAKQRAPFLIKHLVEFFMKEDAAAKQDLPTDEQFREDEVIQRKLERIVEMAEDYQHQAKLDLARKVSLAKSVAKILRLQSLD